MAHIVKNLSNVKNPVAGFVVICVFLSLSAVVITCVVALAWGEIPADRVSAIVAIASTGGSLLFGGLLMMARGYSSVMNSVYYPVCSDDFGIPKI